MGVKNTSDHYARNTTEVDLMKNIFISILLMLFVCGGNLLTIAAILRYNNLKTIPNMYILFLALSDLLVGLVLPSQMLLVQIPAVSYLYFKEQYMCLGYIALQRIPLCLSLFCITLVSFDRYLYIVQPFLYTRITLTHVKVSVSFSCVISLVYGSIIFFDNRWDDEAGCAMPHVLTKGYNLYSAVLLFSSASFISMMCYIFIIRTALRQRREIYDLSLAESTSKRLQMKSKFRLVKMFALVFGIYFICWLPNIINIYLAYEASDPGNIIDMISVPLLVLNSGSNCFVYAWIDKNFRVAFKKILCKCSRVD